LLAVEAAAADGVYYTTSVSSEPSDPGEPGEVESKPDEANTNGGKPLQIHIPYFGTIKIDLGSAFGVEEEPLEQPLSPSAWPFWPRIAGGNDERFSFENLDNCQTRTPDVNNRLRSVWSHLDILENSNLEDNFPFSALDQNSADPAGFLVPEPIVDIDDWPLQGVDMALFDNLIRGSLEPEAERSLTHRASTASTQAQS
jgi:hypothetical protein